MKEPQIIPDAKPRGHAPMLWKAEYRLDSATPAKGETRWSECTLSKLLQFDGAGSEIPQEAER
eukprot:5426729-Pyramimonas_sp.AAC.1